MSPQLHSSLHFTPHAPSSFFASLPMSPQLHSSLHPVQRLSLVLLFLLRREASAPGERTPHGGPQGAACHRAQLPDEPRGLRGRLCDLRELPRGEPGSRGRRPGGAEEAEAAVGGGPPRCLTLLPPHLTTIATPLAHFAHPLIPSFRLTCEAACHHHHTTLSPSLSLSHTHNHTVTHTHIHTLSLSLSLSHTHKHTHIHTLSLSLPPSLSLSHTYTHTHTHTHTQARSPPFPPSLNTVPNSAPAITT